jgi:hypothetical protein
MMGFRGLTFEKSLAAFSPEKTSTAVKVEDASLEELLLELKNFGKPRVGIYGSDGTWHCSVDMNTNTVGADFQCKSDFNQPNPTAAAKQCLERVLIAVEQYRK